MRATHGAERKAQSAEQETSGSERCALSSALPITQWKRWLGDAAERNAEKIAASTVFIGLFSKNYREDALCLLQLGIAVMLDKPILMVVPPDALVPETLRKMAAGFCVIDMRAPGSSQVVTAWIKKQIDELEAGKTP